MRSIYSIFLIFWAFAAFSQGPFAGPVGHSSTTAIHKDSSIIKGWATSALVVRGWQQITDTTLGRVTVGDSSSAVGSALTNGVVSLGDGGVATVQFGTSIFDGPGPDFAVFENSFSDTFLELAFVEVSSDGQNYFRFPAESYSDTVTQIGGFGSLNATHIHHLAGKYRIGYGTPFDLSDLIGNVGLDLQNITHVRIIDVIGTLDSTYANHDIMGRKINDPFPTPFPSGGFDLDAVGAIHLNPVGLDESSNELRVKIYPNPVEDKLQISRLELSSIDYEIRDLQGKLIQEGRVSNSSIPTDQLRSGQYVLIIRSESAIDTQLFMKL